MWHSWHSVWGKCSGGSHKSHLPPEQLKVRLTERLLQLPTRREEAFIVTYHVQEKQMALTVNWKSQAQRFLVLGSDVWLSGFSHGQLCHEWLQVYSGFKQYLKVQESLRESIYFGTNVEIFLFFFFFQKHTEWGPQVSLVQATTSWFLPARWTQMFSWEVVKRSS